MACAALHGAEIRIELNLFITCRNIDGGGCVEVRGPGGLLFAQQLHRKALEMVHELEEDLETELFRGSSTSREISRR